MRLKLLEHKGLAARSAPDIWVATELAASVAVSHAAPDNYEVVKQIGVGRFFRARRDRRPGLFEVAEHANIGRGWAIRDLQSGELISEQDLANIEPFTGYVYRCAKCGHRDELDIETNNAWRMIRERAMCRSVPPVALR
ncbi:hypothetical protein [Burkholderia gladioli]|uniref:hypothetical protein n=1 Tax=Burkholderia gladioli TaxID=28095 RepID=UPI00163E91C3|nr:hypothetical protein [Burkholderia gladioli]